MPKVQRGAKMKKLPKGICTIKLLRDITFEAVESSRRIRISLQKNDKVNVIIVEDLGDNVRMQITDQDNNTIVSKQVFEYHPYDLKGRIREKRRDANKRYREAEKDREKSQYTDIDALEQSCFNEGYIQALDEITTLLKMMPRHS